MVSRALEARLVRLEQWAVKAPPARPEPKVRKAMQAPQVRKAPRAQLGKPALKG